MRVNTFQANTKHINCYSRALCVAAAPQRRCVVSNAIDTQGYSRACAAKFACVHASTANSRSSLACRATDYRSKPAGDISVAVFGATGYIGRKVTDEMISRGFKVTPVARDSSGIGGKQGRADVEALFPKAECRFTDVTDSSAIAKDVFDSPKDVVVCCLASRTGGIKDSWDIDYQATKNCMDAAVASGASHFVLLSAICVQKPLLEFQKAKLKFEEELQASDDITYSIVRPTAFFKSLAGQVESVKKGGPYVMFGDGHLAACKPISEEDLATFMGVCVTESDQINQVLPVGGPGEALDPQQQSEILFSLLGTEPRTLKVPVAIMDVVIGALEGLGNFLPNLKEAAEFGRIGKYYATESMLVYDPATGKYDAAATPSYGETTLEMFFDKALKEGLAGQELGDQAVFGQK